MSLAGALLSGDVRALARAISLAEDRDPQASQLVAEVQPHTGNAYLVGLTGAPGTGKSTLADALVKVIRDRQQTVGVIAVDPSSPFTGGRSSATGSACRVIPSTKASSSAAWAPADIWGASPPRPARRSTCWTPTGAT